MTELKYRTNGGGSPKGKPRVYFTCHPADLDRSLDRICEDLFRAADCAVYYTADMGDRLPEETRETDLERMNLFVIPVSLKLLLEPNRAMEEDFPFAAAKHIPVLPIMLEPGLDPVYGRADKFGTRQYLDPGLVDPTAVPYAEKLKNYLGSVLIHTEIVRRIRAAFDAGIFLSYRKKDRKQANELMRLIHSDPKCRDIAVWFDEFLTPGESFDAGIREAMEKSSLFTLLVTPSLLEPGELGGPNYVRAKEYPEARDAGMELLAAESVPTDRAALLEGFPGLPEPLNVERPAERERFLERLRALDAEENNGEAEHLYLIGLAYLEGIDAETDRDRGLQLITAAGNAELPEAMEKLYRMYREGLGVPVDYRRAAYWAEKTADWYVKNFGEEEPAALSPLQNLVNMYMELGEDQKALEQAEKNYMLMSRVFEEKDPHTLTALSTLASAHEALGEFRLALPLKEKVYALRREILGDSHPDTLVALAGLGNSCYAMGEYRKALLLQERAYAMLREKLGEPHPTVLWVLSNLSSTYGALRYFEEEVSSRETVFSMISLGKVRNHPDLLRAQRDLAETWYRMDDEAYSLKLTARVYLDQCRSLGEAHPETMASLDRMAGIFLNYDDQETALGLRERAYALRRRALGEEHPDTLASLNQLAAVYGSMGERETERRLKEKVYAGLCAAPPGERPEYLDALGELVAVCEELGDRGRKLELRESEYAILCKSRGADHPSAFYALNELAVMYWNDGEHAKALGMMEDAYDRHERILGEYHPDSNAVLENLAVCYDALRQYGKAAEAREKLYAVRSRLYGDSFPDRYELLLDLCADCLKAGKLRKAWKYGRLYFRA